MDFDSLESLSDENLQNLYNEAISSGERDNLIADCVCKISDGSTLYEADCRILYSTLVENGLYGQNSWIEMCRRLCWTRFEATVTRNYYSVTCPGVSGFHHMRFDSATNMMKGYCAGYCN